MSNTLPPLLTAVSDVLAVLGQRLLAWRTDASARFLHSRAVFKTQADRQADAFLKENLLRIDPTTPVLSEEDSTHGDARPRRYWLIDPIDGTASWYEGFSGFVTQAALIENDEPALGCLHAPALGRTWSAAGGVGAWMNGTLLPRLTTTARCVIVDNTPHPHGIAARVSARLPATGYRESGSLGLKAALVADGNVDLFIKDVTIRDWDLAPAAVVLKETGGCLRRLTGEPYRFAGPIEKQGVLVARDDALVDRVVAALNPP